MLFGRTFDNPALLGRIRRLRKNPVAGYAVALGAVTIATLVRWAVTQLVSATAPFVTYFLAIIFVALACGFWPGMVAVLLSVLAGAVLFLPPAFSFAVDPAEVWALLLFAVVASINVALTSELIAGLLIEDERQKFLIQELRHRSQNLFAIIQTIVSRSFVAGQTSSQAKEALEGRLAALARTHAMLADTACNRTATNPDIQFTFLGYTFRPRKAVDKYGRVYVNFSPAVPPSKRCGRQSGDGGSN